MTVGTMTDATVTTPLQINPTINMPAIAVKAVPIRHMRSIPTRRTMRLPRKAPAMKPTDAPPKDSPKFISDIPSSPTSTKDAPIRYANSPPKVPITVSR